MDKSNFSRVIRVVSQDQALLGMCRDIMRGMPDQSWSVVSAAECEAGPEPDIFLWDVNPEHPVPPDPDTDLSKYLFLVNRNEIPGFQEKIQRSGAGVLLKPVTRATLDVFLTQAIMAVQDEDLPPVDPRADGEDLLQYLIQTNLRLQEYDQDRTTFLAKAVHDFRAPLTALSGYCGLLLSEDLGPLHEMQKEVLRRMNHSAKRLARMTNAMFELSVGRHVVRQPDLKPGDLRKTLDQALHEITPVADDKNIAIRTDLVPCDGILEFEAGPIEQVLINVLDNACRFTPKAGLIEITGYLFFWERRAANCSIRTAAERRRIAATDSNSYRLDIQNSGAPIPEEFLDRIFEEYTSYGGSRDRSGGGLGLPITRMIVTRHEGRVWAENTPAGPKISIVLPISRQLSLQAREALVKTA